MREKKRNTSQSHRLEHASRLLATLRVQGWSAKFVWSWLHISKREQSKYVWSVRNSYILLVFSCKKTHEILFLFNILEAKARHWMRNRRGSKETLCHFNTATQSQRMIHHHHSKNTTPVTLCMRLWVFMCAVCIHADSDEMCKSFITDDKWQPRQEDNNKKNTKKTHASQI